MMIGEYRTGRHERILTSAEDLVLKRGFKGVTIAEIAQNAHVGKGTFYLYWRTKESLFIELIARGFLTVLEELSAQIQVRPHLARPDQLCINLVHSALRQPLVRALQTNDADILGLLADDPRSRELLDQHGAAALIRAMVPVWRRHGLARLDWDLDRQAYALQMLAVGFMETTTRRETIVISLTPADRDSAMADAVCALLDTPAKSSTPPGAAALDVIEILETTRTALYTSISGDR